MIQDYTTPQIYKGKIPKSIPKGSTKKKELVKNSWSINYTFKGKQQRIKKGINRIHDYDERLDYAQTLLEVIKKELKDGYDPENPDEYDLKLLGRAFPLKDSIDEFLEYTKLFARPKTVQSYSSKLYHFVHQFKEKNVNEITSKNIEEYIRNRINNTEHDTMFINGELIVLNKITRWSPKTVKNAKGIFSIFFNYCVDRDYLKINPINKVELKLIKSDVAPKKTNIPYSDAHLTMLMAYLDQNDPFVALFCRFIYYTLLRPKEVSSLKLENIDMKNRMIQVPMNIMKNTKKNKNDEIKINQDLYDLLCKLDISQYPKHYFLFSKDFLNVAGESKLNYGRVYKRLMKACKINGIGNNGYTLYAFKHTSNIKRLTNGWEVDELMKANRHSDYKMTQEYIKNITHQTDIDHLKVPSI